MAEVNEEMIDVQEPVSNEQPEEAAKPGFGAKVKEWFRKRAVKLKRKPQNIFLLFLAAITIFNLLTLTTYSEFVIKAAKKEEWIGLLVFVNTLLSILVLVSALGIYPKLKKKGSKIVVTMEEKGSKLNVNLFMFAVTIVFIAVMIICECFFINKVSAFQKREYIDKVVTDATKRSAEVCAMSLSYSITHIILLGIATLLLMTLPLYRKLIMMINTSVKLESASENMQAIDLED